MHSPTISIIVAMDEKRGIGKAGKIPWHIKEDLVRLKRLTYGNTVILGRKSYESMVWYYNKSGRPMPGKRYLVVTHDQTYKPEKEHAIAVSSVEDALQKAKKSGDDEVSIIGGTQIFQQAIPFADKLYITLVKGDYHADRFFPEYPSFTKVVNKEEKTGEGYTYTFLDLEK